MADPKRWKFTVNDFWLKSKEEVLDGINYIDSDIVDSAFYNIQKIIDSCNVTFGKENHLPRFQEMSDKEENEYLEELTMEKATTRIRDRDELNPIILL